MDSDLVYAKTAAGEDAVQKRTRVMQRNERMVLILVDGHSTVDNLCHKTDNPQLTEEALALLEKSGLIELRVDQDSLWEEERKVAEEIRASATNRHPSERAEQAVGGSVSSGGKAEEHASAHAVVPASGHDASDTRISPAPWQAAGEDPPASKPASGMKPISAPRSEHGEIFEPPNAVPHRRRSRKNNGKTDSDDEISIRPIRRGSPSSRKWTTRLLGGLAGIVAFFSLAVLFFPYATYLPEVEAVLSQTMGRPVKVGAMRVNFYPHPGLQLDDVHLGSGDRAVRIAEISLLPDPASLLASKIIIRDAFVKGATIPIDFITGLPVVFESMAEPAAKFAIQRLGFENTGLSFGGFLLRDLDGEASLGANGRLQQLSLHTEDRGLSLAIRPLAKGVAVVFEALGWRPLTQVPLIFDSIALKARLDNGELAIDNMDLRVFDGLIQGRGNLLTGRRTAISGDIRFERIDTSKLGEALGIGPQFTGDAAGTMHFSSAFEVWQDAFSRIEAESDFSIRRGSIRGIDLAEAVRRDSGVPVQGGSTAFEDMSGKLKFAPGVCLFSGLVMNSGLMQSTGYLRIGKGLETSGRMELKIRGTVNQRQVPVLISGPLSSPMVRVVGR